MPSPFPGMDPYLEQRELWPSVHTRLIAGIDEALAPQLPPAYYSSIEERFYLAAGEATPRAAVADVLVARDHGTGQPTGANGGHHVSAPGAAAQMEARGGGVAVLEVEVPAPGPVRQRHIEIRTVGGHEVVTVIEVLSPVNKAPGEGRRQYETTRQATLDSLANLVEIDLLRLGEPLATRMDGQPVTGELAGDYRILVSRAAQRPRAELMVMHLPDPLPVVPVPLREGETELEVDMQALLANVYDIGRYERRVDYRTAPTPPLQEELAE